jgi:hypothetical protein
MEPIRHLIEHTSLHTFPPPLLDDWVESRPDAWDYDAVLREYEVSVEWRRAGGYWWFSWKHGCIHIGQTTEIIAHKAAALFVSLWLRNVSASFCDKLMDGFVCYLERQEQTSLVFQAEIDSKLYSHAQPFFRLTREGLCTRAPFLLTTEHKIIEALDVQPDEEIIITFTKRKKQP